jgi:hypothetical protein
MWAPLRRAVASFLICAVLLAGVGTLHAAAGEAGLVVEHGDGTTVYVLVVFSEDNISSLELLRRSGLSLTTVASGGLGEAVCSIEREGCNLSDCRTNLCQTGDPESPFWKFFRVGSSGAWIAQPLGASATKVRDGDVDFWSWTGGEATIPVINLSRVIEMTAAPLDRSTGNVYTAWFDANGNAINPPSTDSANDNPLLEGAVLIALIIVIGFLMVRRQRRLLGDGALRR